MMMMFEPIDIHQRLIKERKKEIHSEDIVGWAYSVLNDETEETNILQRLSKSPIERDINNFDIDKVETDAIFHITQIRKICVDYRLRFLDTKYFKGQYPQEVVEKIQKIEADHNTTLDGFKIIAPSKLFTLDKADDPLLFAPMGNGYYYLIHKWGTDLHPFRKIKYWSIKNVENLGVSLFIVSFLLTLATKNFIFDESATFGHVFMLFLFYVKGVLGMIFMYGAASGKNFSQYAWQSRYDKIS
jgi:hypothetical protein